MANVHVSWLDPQKIRRMTIVGSEKMVVYDDLADNKVAIYDKGIDRMADLEQTMDFDSPMFELIYRSGDIIMPKIDWTEPLQSEIEHFVDCILGNSTCLTSVSHARKVIQILSSVDETRKS